MTLSDINFWPWSTVSALICSYNPTGTRRRRGLAATLTNSWVVSLGLVRLYHIPHNQSRSSYTLTPSYLTTATYHNNSLHIYKDDSWALSKETTWCIVDMHIHASHFWLPWFTWWCSGLFHCPVVSDACNALRSKIEWHYCSTVMGHAASSHKSSYLSGLCVNNVGYTGGK